MYSEGNWSQDMFDKDVILNKTYSPSILSALKLKNLLPILFLTSILYFKFRLVNSWVQVALFLEDLTSKQQKFNLFVNLQFISIIVWIFISVIVYVCHRGRRNFIICVALLISFVSDTTMLGITFKEESIFNIGMQSVYLISASFTYTTFYMVCLLTSCDIAKIEVLRSNVKMLGLLFCIILFF